MRARLILCAVAFILGTAACSSTDHNANERTVTTAAKTPSTTTTVTQTPSTSASTTPPSPVQTTAPVTPCTSCTTAPPTTPESVPAPRSATASDFTGTFTHYRDTCNPCQRGELDKGIALTIRNNTDHPIDLSTAALVRVAAICATNITADGRLNGPLHNFALGDIYADESTNYPPIYAKPGNTLPPGAAATNDGTTSFGFWADPPGKVTCEAALVATTDGSWSQRSLMVIAPLANFRTYTFQLLGSTQTTSTMASTTTGTS